MLLQVAIGLSYLVPFLGYMAEVSASGSMMRGMVGSTYPFQVHVSLAQAQMK